MGRKSRSDSENNPPVEKRTESAPAAQLVTVYSRSGKGFWRCGMHFTPEGRVLDLSEFTDEQRGQITGEVNLLCVPCEKNPRRK